MDLRIKERYLNTVIAFNDSGIVLKKRTQSDLIDLALMAHSSKVKRLQDFFEHLPTVEELQTMKMKLVEVQT